MTNFETLPVRGGSEQVKDWARVAAKLPGRTNKDCRKRWINKVCGNLKRGAWDEDEDQRLRDAVSKYGQRWTLVASMVGSRSSDQCAKRWQHRLDPRLEHEDWTPEEDDLLLENVQTYGREWKFIQEEDFPTRSSNELKNRYVCGRGVTSLRLLGSGVRPVPD
ncbi:Homeodomain-like protein [Thermothelomyces heterothallicus CBS 202.75]|uniref:Homeodomain-like protein n=1 Tax=Thermothelomyces heterothallicus CBS 202.75 TaxID=1149848 RepID=UPI003742D92C